MATPEEIKVAELENKIVVLQTELTNQKDNHNKLHHDHQEHKKNSQYLHILTPFLALFAGIIINWLKDKFGKDKLNEILEKTKAVCSKCQEEVKKD